eukprot:jgi/Tetstr1/448655/TSEL_035898.t1
MVERCTRTQLAYASVEENTLQNRLTDEDMRGEYIHLPGGWTPTHSSNPALYRSLRHAWHWHTLLDVGADALAQYKLFLLDQLDLDGDIVDADTRLTYLRGSDSVWLQGAEDMLEIAAKQAAVLVEHDDDGAMEPLLAGAHAEQFPLFQLMRLTARVVQEALTHTWIQTDRFSRFLSDITKEAHKWETDRAAIPGSTHHVGSFLPYAPLTWTATSPPRLAHMEPIHKWREGYFPTGPGARPASVAHCDANDPAVCSGVQRLNCLPSEVEAFAEAVDATILAAVERVLGVSFDPSTYGTDTNPVVTDFLAELLHDPDPMAAEVATLSEDAVARARSRLYLLTRLKGAGIRRMATVRDAAFIGCMNAILPRFPTRNSGTNTPTSGFFDPQLGSVLGRGSFNATSSARQYDHFLNDAHGSDSYAAEMREAWGRLQAATAGHLGDADARQMEREVEAAPGSQKELTAFLDHANNSRLRNEIILPSTEHNPVTVDLYGDALKNLPAHGDAHGRVHHDAIVDAFRDHCVHDLGIAVRREVDDLFQQAVPLGNTVPRDELKDLVPDAELSLPAFNVVTGSYDPRSLKSTVWEFKTMRDAVKYTAVPRATAVDRFERSLLGDIQRGLAARDAAWHNTEPGQKGPLRDILDMSEYTGMVFGTVDFLGVLSLVAAQERARERASSDGADSFAIPLPKLHSTSKDHPHTHVHAWPGL